MPFPMAPMPPIAAAISGHAGLTKTDKTKTIHGFACTLYTVASRAENLDAWVTNDLALFPFRLITRDYLARRFGPQMLEETWPDMLRNKSLFPLDLGLKIRPGGQERLSFKVQKIEKQKVADPTLFQPPDNYIKIEAPQF